MKKSIAAYMLLTSMPALTLAQVQPEPNASLLIWTDRGAHAEFMQYAGNRFEEIYNVQVDVREVPPIDTIKRLIQDGGSTRVGDVVEIEHDTLGTALSAGVLMENLVSAERISTEFLPESVRAASDSTGTVYGFPVMFNTQVMYYNKELLPDGIPTVESIFDFGKTFSNPRTNQYPIVWDIQNYYTSRMFVRLFGGYEFGNDGTNPKDIGLATPEAVKGLESMVKLKAIFEANSEDIRNPQVRRGLFAEGKVAAIVDGPWALNGFRESGVDLGVSAMPTYKGHNLRTFQTVRMAAVSAFTEYPRAAQVFADFISTEEMALKRYDMTGAISPHIEVMGSLRELNDDFVSALIEQGQNADAMPNIPEIVYVWQPMQAALSDIWDRGHDVKTTLESAESIISQQINAQASN